MTMMLPLLAGINWSRSRRVSGQGTNNCWRRIKLGCEEALEMQVVRACSADEHAATVGETFVCAFRDSQPARSTTRRREMGMSRVTVSMYDHKHLYSLWYNRMVNMEW